MGSGYLSLFLEALGLLGNQSGGRGGFAQKAGCRKSKATSIRSAHLNLLLANVWSSDDVVRNSRHLRQVMATCDFGMARGWMSTPLNYSGIIGVSLAACPCDPTNSITAREAPFLRAALPAGFRGNARSHLHPAI